MEFIWNLFGYNNEEDDELNKLIEDLKYKFSRIPFFVRIFKYKDKVIIYNDKDIMYELKKNNLIEIKDNFYKFVKETRDLIQYEIDKKYKDFDNRTLSVIIPNYNNALFIKKTIYSILKSEYTDLEVIFVDDCSSDNSVEIVRTFFGSDPRVKIYVNDSNQGAYYCRNKGILLSKGYYITIVDGDDFVHKEKFSYEIKNLEKSNKGDLIKYWSFGTAFIRYYIDGDDINNIIKKEPKKSVMYVFYRRLFNHVGFYHDNRFGADTEFRMRSEYFGYKFNANKYRHFYYAYVQEGKNLTTTVNEGKRWHYLDKRIKSFTNREYIPMALLDNTNDFAQILNL